VRRFCAAFSHVTDFTPREGQPQTPATRVCQSSRGLEHSRTAGAAIQATAAPTAYGRPGKHGSCRGVYRRGLRDASPTEDLTPRREGAKKAAVPPNFCVLAPWRESFSASPLISAVHSSDQRPISDSPRLEIWARMEFTKEQTFLAERFRTEDTEPTEKDDRTDALELRVLRVLRSSQGWVHQVTEPLQPSGCAIRERQQGWLEESGSRAARSPRGTDHSASSSRREPSTRTTQFSMWVTCSLASS
jgi:hypothetical protein